MKNEKLLQLLGEINTDLIVSANKPYRKNTLRALALVACIALVVGVAIYALPYKTKKLPKITVCDDFGGMGYEALMAYDVSELVNANPWSEDMKLSTLPVYKNMYTYDESLNIPKSSEEYTEILVKEAKKRLDGENATVSASGADSVIIEFSPAIEFPQKYSFNHYCSYEEISDLAEYVKKKYSHIIDMPDPIINIYGGDYDIYDRRMLNISFYNNSKSDTEKILNYNFNTVHFFRDENGKLNLVGITECDLSQKLGEYPIITLKKAEKELYRGYYITTVPHKINKDMKIEKAELIYRNHGYDKYYMPYYKFYIEIPNNVGSGIKSYGVYYVPAVESRYLENMTVWDGSFN